MRGCHGPLLANKTSCSNSLGSPTSKTTLEGSMRFSRTRSVGRVRDRVLRRSTLSEDLFGALLLEERSLIRSSSQVFSRQTMARMSSSTQANEALQSSHVDGSTGSGQLHSLGASQIRDIGNHDLLEHGLAFLERRRRIRSQVRALQRLGSRFENPSGHDRSCILSGQHRTGQCTGRSSNRPSSHHNNDTSNTSSISRIVMLAEALFEVLDEIHQQSAVLPSRQSIPSLGSVPYSPTTSCNPPNARISFMLLSFSFNLDSSLVISKIILLSSCIHFISTSYG